MARILSQLSSTRQQKAKTQKKTKTKRETSAFSSNLAATQISLGRRQISCSHHSLSIRLMIPICHPGLISSVQGAPIAGSLGTEASPTYRGGSAGMPSSQVSLFFTRFRFDMSSAVCSGGRADVVGSPAPPPLVAAGPATGKIVVFTSGVVGSNRTISLTFPLLSNAGCSILTHVLPGFGSHVAGMPTKTVPLEALAKMLQKSSEKVRYPAELVLSPLATSQKLGPPLMAYWSLTKRRPLALAYVWRSLKRGSPRGRPEKERDLSAGGTSKNWF